MNSDENDYRLVGEIFKEAFLKSLLNLGDEAEGLSFFCVGEESGESDVEI